MAATSFKPRAFSTIIEMLVNVFIFIFLYASLSEPDSFFAGGRCGVYLQITTGKLEFNQEFQS